MRIRLRQLEVFAAVCRHGGIAAAAAHLPLSQSAASQALAELEAALDAPLFERAGRRLVLNERGRELLPRALALLEQAQALESQARTGALAGTVRLAASLTIGSYLLPPLLARLQARHPQLCVELAVVNTQGVIDAAARFAADAGFIEGPARHPELDIRPWRDDALAVIAAPGHPLARKRRLRPADLGACAWALREPGSGTREVFERAAQRAGFVPQAVLELGQSEAVRRAVAASELLGCLSYLALAEARTRGEIAILRAPFLDLRRKLYVVLHRRKFVSASLAAVLAVCKVPVTAPPR
ncbi:MAG: LysR family transcriptional regulator [Nevskia sp.]|nr:LysR family transcriptional regulator [Nevskia sp.]